MLVLIFLLAFFNGQSYGQFTNTSQTTGWIKMLDCSTAAKQGAIVPINICIHAPTSNVGGKAVKYINVVDHNDGSVDDDDLISYQIATYYTSDCSDANPISVSSKLVAAKKAPLSNACDPLNDGHISITHHATIITTAANVKSALDTFASTGVVERYNYFFIYLLGLIYSIKTFYKNYF
jgi:hypothetical protein